MGFYELTVYDTLDSSNNKKYINPPSRKIKYLKEPQEEPQGGGSLQICSFRLGYFSHFSVGFAKQSYKTHNALIFINGLAFLSSFYQKQEQEEEKLTRFNCICE